MNHVRIKGARCNSILLCFDNHIITPPRCDHWGLEISWQDFPNIRLFLPDRRGCALDEGDIPFPTVTSRRYSLPAIVYSAFPPSLFSTSVPTTGRGQEFHPDQHLRHEFFFRQSTLRNQHCLNLTIGHSSPQIRDFKPTCMRNIFLTTPAAKSLPVPFPGVPASFGKQP